MQIPTCKTRETVKLCDMCAHKDTTASCFCFDATKSESLPKLTETAE